VYNTEEISAINNFIEALPIPSKYFDPLTLEFMNDPVIVTLPAGFSINKGDMEILREGIKESKKFHFNRFLINK